MTEILYAEDDAAMRQMVAEALSAAGFQVRLATNGHEALEALHTQAPDLLLLDYRMGDPDGFEVCRRVKAEPRLQHLPVLILTAQGEVENRLRGFDAGADDYLPKPFDARELLARVRALLRLYRQGLDRNPTTGIPGGSALEREFQRRADAGEPIAVCYFDLDDFKPFSDHFGFATADRAIREASQALYTAARGSDAFVGHVGGDDFMVIAHPEEARLLAETARQEFQRRVRAQLPPEIVRRGHYEGKDRAGRTREFPLTSLSAAIVHLPPGSRLSLPELGEVVAEAKRRAKRPGGSGVEEVELD